MTSTENGRGDAGPAERRILKRGMLHSPAGIIRQQGWMTQPLLRYDRARVKKGRIHLKEWDRYLINDDTYALWLTMANFGYLGFVSAQLFNLVHPSSRSFFGTVPLSLRRMELPQNSVTGSTRFATRRMRFLGRAHDDERRVMVNLDEFIGGQTLAVDALFDRPPAESFATVAGGTADDGAFRYRRTVPAFRASGSVKVGRRVHGFSPTRSFGLYSWNRASVATETGTVEVCAQGWQDGDGGDGCDTHVVALLLSDNGNVPLGGQGNAPSARDNAIIIDGRAFHIGPVRFEIPKAADATAEKAAASTLDVLGAWHIADEEGTVDLSFVPDQVQRDYHNMGAFLIDWQQVCGVFSGTVQVEGEAFAVQRLRGMASLEHARCLW